VWVKEKVADRDIVNTYWTLKDGTLPYKLHVVITKRVYGMPWKPSVQGLRDYKGKDCFADNRKCYLRWYVDIWYAAPRSGKEKKLWLRKDVNLDTVSDAIYAVRSAVVTMVLGFSRKAVPEGLRADAAPKGNQYGEWFGTDIEWAYL